MPKFRFETVLRLRETERDQARSHLSEAYEALRRVEEREQQLSQERQQLLIEAQRRRTGTLSIESLLSDGRYELQLEAECRQLRDAASQIQAEIERRQAAVTAANTAVRQLEILKEHDRKAIEIKQDKLVQGYMDEVAARRARLAQLQTEASD